MTAKKCACWAVAMAAIGGRGGMAQIPGHAAPPRTQAFPPPRQAFPPGPRAPHVPGLRVQPELPRVPQFRLPLLVPHYIVAELLRVDVHDDEDGTGAGEIFIVAGGGTGEPGFPPSVSTANFPIRLWREIDSGHDFAAAIPLLVRPEAEMRDTLGLVVSVFDNDEHPGWLDRSLPKLSEAAGTYLATELAGPAAGMFGGAAGEALTAAYLEWLGSSEIIGKMERWHSRDFDRGGLPVPGGEIPENCAYHTVEAGDMTAKYRVCRIPALPGRYRAFVTLDRIRVHKDGDTHAGDVYSHVRVFNGMEAPVDRRFPAAGTTSREDGTIWEVGELVYNGAPTSVPVLYVEVDVWDEDDEDVGDDDDMLGIATWPIRLVDLELPRAPGERRHYPLSQRVSNPERVDGEVTIEATLTMLRE